MHVIEQRLRLRHQRLCVVHLGLVGNGPQIRDRDLLHHLAARGHFVEIRRALRRTRHLPALDHRPRKQDLAKVNLPLGQIVAGNERESRGNLAAGKQRRELADGFGAEALRREVVHVIAGVAGEPDGRQKLLERLVPHAVQGLLAVLSFSQSQIVFEAALDGVVQRQLEGLVCHLLHSDAAVERIGRGGRILPLRKHSPGPNPHEKREKERGHGPPEVKMKRWVHCHYFLRCAWACEDSAERAKFMQIRPGNGMRP